MASSFSLLCLVLTLSLLPQIYYSLVLPVTKDPATLQYLTTLSHGTPLVPTNLVLDLGGQHLWLDCASRQTPSSSLTPIPHRSIQCLTAKSHKIETQAWLITLDDQDQPCQILSENTITGTKATEGELVQDLMALPTKFQKDQHQVLFTCSPTPLLKGLASSAKGMVGLGRSRSSFTSQIFDSLTAHRKITLCLSSSTGMVQFGNVPHESQPEVLRSLTTFTPLVTNQKNPSQEHFINVNAVKIGGKKVSFNTPSLSQDGNGVAMLSTVVPYTTMQSSIYANFESAYLKAALAANMTKVDPVAPFGLCFGSGGPSVPVIELVLQSEMVKWSIHGRNSMVRVNDDVVCLGFLDGGENARNPIVIGGFQLEDVLVQFDLDSNMVGFSSSLLMKGSSCSDFKLAGSSSSSSSTPAAQSV